MFTISISIFTVKERERERVVQYNLPVGQPIWVHQNLVLPKGIPESSPSSIMKFKKINNFKQVK